MGVVIWIGVGDMALLLKWGKYKEGVRFGNGRVLYPFTY